MVLLTVLTLLGLVIPLYAKFTINVSTLDKQYALEFNNLEGVMPDDLRKALATKMGDAEKARRISLCRPPQNMLGSSSEFDESAPIATQGIVWGWLRGNSFTLDQNYVLLLDKFAGEEQMVTACAESTIEQILKRADVSAYPAGTIYKYEEGARKTAFEKKSIGVDPQDMKRIKVTPELSIGDKWMVWMKAGWVRSFETTSSRLLKLRVNKQPQSSLYQIFDHGTGKIPQKTIDSLDAKEHDGIVIPGRIPISKEIVRAPMVKIEPHYGLVLYLDKLYEVSVSPDIDEVDLKREIKSAIGTTLINFSPDPKKEHFASHIKENHQVILATGTSLFGLRPLQVAPAEHSSLAQYAKMKRLQWQSLSAESKAMIGLTVLLIVLAIVGLVYMWARPPPVVDPVLADIEQDLAATERIQREYTKQ